jgi:uncharacterized protein
MHKRIYALIADLHLYIGLFLSPFVLLFAASVILLNHPGIPLGAQAKATTRSVQVHPPPGLEKLEGMARVQQARQILREAGLSGEIGPVQHSAQVQTLTIPVSKPGYEAEVEVNLSTGLASIEERETGFWSSLIFLHKMPGPHLANIRGNWPPLRVWAWLADGTAWLLIFLSVSGIYLWTVLRSERRVGMLLILAGAISLAGCLYAICI